MHGTNGVWYKSFNEPFKTDADIDNDMQRIISKPKSVVKCHKWHIEMCQKAGRYEEFKQLFDYRILLIRRDQLAATLSLCISMETDSWVKIKTREPVYINPLNFIQEYKHTVQSQMDLIKNHSFNIDYDQILFTEQMGTRPSYTMSLINLAQGLDIPQTKNRIPMMLPSESMITNYNELMEYADFYHNDLRQYVPDNVVLRPSKNMWIEKIL